MHDLYTKAQQAGLLVDNRAAYIFEQLRKDIRERKQPKFVPEFKKDAQGENILDEDGVPTPSMKLETKDNTGDTQCDIEPAFCEVACSVCLEIMRLQMPTAQSRFDIENYANMTVFEDIKAFDETKNESDIKMVVLSQNCTRPSCLIHEKCLQMCVQPECPICRKPIKKFFTFSDWLDSMEDETNRRDLEARHPDVFVSYELTRGMISSFLHPAPAPAPAPPTGDLVALWAFPDVTSEDDVYRYNEQQCDAIRTIIRDYCVTLLPDDDGPDFDDPIPWMVALHDNGLPWMANYLRNLAYRLNVDVNNHRVHVVLATHPLLWQELEINPTPAWQELEEFHLILTDNPEVRGRMIQEDAMNYHNEDTQMISTHRFRFLHFCDASFIEMGTDHNENYLIILDCTQLRFAPAYH